MDQENIYNIGDNLTTYPNLDFLEADGPNELKDQLQQIRLPYKILSIYSNGRKHFAWITLTKPIIKKKINKKLGE